MSSALFRSLHSALVWALLCAVLALGAPAWAGGLVVDMLDVGQGDSVLIRTEQKTVLIDAGLRKANVVQQLKKLGVDHLDLVVTTHPHADHMGGMAAVLEVFKPKIYMDNGLPHTTKTYQELMTLIEEEKIPYRTAKQGMNLNLGAEATFKVLWPRERPIRGTRSDLNSNSVVLKLTHGEKTFLFTGDAEEPTEQALQQLDVGKVDVLKVAHHGSGHSSTPGFLRAVDATFALVSCGEGNRYGHPDPESMKRLKRSGALIFRTDLSGQIRVISDGKEVEILEGSIDELAGMRLPWESARRVPAHGVSH